MGSSNHEEQAGVLCGQSAVEKVPRSAQMVVTVNGGFRCWDGREWEEGFGMRHLLVKLG